MVIAKNSPASNPFIFVAQQQYNWNDAAFDTSEDDTEDEDLSVPGAEDIDTGGQPGQVRPGVVGSRRDVNTWSNHRTWLQSGVARYRAQPGGHILQIKFVKISFDREWQ